MKTVPERLMIAKPREEATTILIEGVEFPALPVVYCTRCGKRANSKINPRMRYNHDTGAEEPNPEIVYRCPSFPHRLAPTARYFWGRKWVNGAWAQYRNGAWEECMHYDDV